MFVTLSAFCCQWYHAGNICNFFIQMEMSFEKKICEEKKTETKVT